MPAPASFLRRHPDFVVCALLFLTGAAAAAWLLFAWPRPAVKYDAVEYLELGRSLAAGLGYRYGPDSYPTAYRPPLYPFLLAGAFKLFGDALDTAYGLQAVLHGATVAAVFALARFLMPRPFAVGAALLAAVSVGLTSLAGFLMTETAQAFLTTAGMAATLWWLRTYSAKRAGLSGLCWGLAALAKGTNLVFLALLPVGLLIGWRDDWRRWLRGYVAAWLVAVAVMVPWTARNWTLFGRPVFVSTNVGIQLYVSTLDPITFDTSDPRLAAVYDAARSGSLNEAETDRLFMQRALAVLGADPVPLLRRMATNAWRLYELPPRDSIEYLKPTVLYNDLPEYQRLVWLHYVLLGASGFGLLLMLAYRRRELLLLWTVPVGVALIYAPFWVIYRFTAQALPVLYVVAGAGVWLAVNVAVSGWVSAALKGGPATGFGRPALQGGESPPAVGMGNWPGVLVLTLAVAASALIFWQAHRPGWIVESAHPYRPNADLVWAIVNPDDTAAQTRVHFTRMQLAGPGDRIILLSGDFQILEELHARDFVQGGWTQPHPGRLIVVKLLTDGQGEDWGFAVDGVGGVAR